MMNGVENKKLAGLAAAGAMVLAVVAGWLTVSRMDGSRLSARSETSAEKQASSAHDGSLLPRAERKRLPPDGGPEYNSLIHETSPYLLQHADNPVTWFPWGDAAFEKAEEENKPIFLSVGYSTCHWCHVMERESFTDPDIARVLNENFVSIKVDREQRPDVDDYYMKATRMLSGGGGWPNSVWLTPDGKPWFAGTYFPPDRFKNLLKRLDDAWQQRPGEVRKAAEQVAERIRRTSSPSEPGELSPEIVAALKQELESTFDEKHGGFGGAPKFPPHESLRFLLYRHRITGEDGLLEMATATLDAMARGGIRDHLGGGFHRYSTDAEWLVPHFEKMLYDNALLPRLYVKAYRQTDREMYRRVAEHTYGWILERMRGNDRGFYTAVSSESGGREGGYYLWTRKRIMDVLGPEAGRLFCEVYGVTETGNFQHGRAPESGNLNILHLPRPIPEVAQSKGIPEKKLRSRLAEARAALLEARRARPHPDIDDKVLASWNGLMISSLAFAGQHLDKRRYIEAAERAADFVLNDMRRSGRLMHAYRSGQARVDGFLRDYAFMADAALQLHCATGKNRWLREARELMDVLLADFQDGENGGFFNTAGGGEGPVARLKEPGGGSLPSGNGVAARVLLRLHEETGAQRYLDATRRTLEAFAGSMRRSTRYSATLVTAAARYFEVAPANRKEGEGSREGGVNTVTASTDRTSVRIRPPAQPVEPGQELTLPIRLTVDDGWHVNSHDPLQDYLKPTTVELAENPAVALEQVNYPEGERIALDFSDEDLSVYTGTVRMTARLRIKDDAPAGRHVLEFRVRVQACNDRRCLLPQTVLLTVPVEVVSEGGRADGHQPAGALRFAPGLRTAERRGGNT